MLIKNGHKIKPRASCMYLQCMNPFLTIDPTDKHSTLHLKSNSLTIHLTTAQGYLTITQGFHQKDIAYFATTFNFPTSMNQSPPF